MIRRSVCKTVPKHPTVDELAYWKATGYFESNGCAIVPVKELRRRREESENAQERVKALREELRKLNDKLNAVLRGED